MHEGIKSRVNVENTYCSLEQHLSSFCFILQNINISMYGKIKIACVE
jgi:hypothetical protein